MPSSMPFAADSSGPIFSSPAASNLLSSSSYRLSPSPRPSACLDGEQEASDETIVPSNFARPAMPSESQPTGSNATGSSFFEEERRRLLWDISESLEMVLNHTNALNRNLEEWIRVRSLIDDSSELYDQFAALLRRLRLDGFDGQGEREGKSEGKEGAGQGGDGERSMPPRKDIEGEGEGEGEPTRTGMTAPGGGSWNPQTSVWKESDITVAIHSREA